MDMDFHSMTRKGLQALCKKHNLPANGTNSKMADALSALLNQAHQEIKTKDPCLKDFAEETVVQVAELDPVDPKAITRAPKKVRFVLQEEISDAEISHGKRKFGRISTEIVPEAQENGVKSRKNESDGIVEEERETVVRTTRSRARKSLVGDVTPFPIVGKGKTINGCELELNGEKRNSNNVNTRWKVGRSSNRAGEIEEDWKDSGQLRDANELTEIDAQTEKVTRRSKRNASKLAVSVPAGAEMQEEVEVPLRIPLEAEETGVKSRDNGTVEEEQEMLVRTTRSHTRKSSVGDAARFPVVETGVTSRDKESGGAVDEEQEMFVRTTRSRTRKSLVGDATRFPVVETGVMSRDKESGGAVDEEQEMFVRTTRSRTRKSLVGDATRFPVVETGVTSRHKESGGAVDEEQEMFVRTTRSRTRKSLVGDATRFPVVETGVTSIDKESGGAVDEEQEMFVRTTRSCTQKSLAGEATRFPVVEMRKTRNGSGSEISKEKNVNCDREEKKKPSRAKGKRGVGEISNRDDENDGDPKKSGLLGEANELTELHAQLHKGTRRSKCNASKLSVSARADAEMQEDEVGGGPLKVPVESEETGMKSGNGECNETIEKEQENLVRTTRSRAKKLLVGDVIQFPIVEKKTTRNGFESGIDEEKDVNGEREEKKKQGRAKAKKGVGEDSNRDGEHDGDWKKSGLLSEPNELTEIHAQPDKCTRRSKRNISKLAVSAPADTETEMLKDEVGGGPLKVPVESEETGMESGNGECNETIEKEQENLVRTTRSRAKKLLVGDVIQFPIVEKKTTRNGFESGIDEEKDVNGEREEKKKQGRAKAKKGVGEGSNRDGEHDGDWKKSGLLSEPNELTEIHAQPDKCTRRSKRNISKLAVSAPADTETEMLKDEVVRVPFKIMVEAEENEMKSEKKESDETIVEKQEMLVRTTRSRAKKSLVGYATQFPIVENKTRKGSELQTAKEKNVNNKGEETRNLSEAKTEWKVGKNSQKGEIKSHQKNSRQPYKENELTQMHSQPEKATRLSKRNVPELAVSVVGDMEMENGEVVKEDEPRKRSRDKTLAAADYVTDCGTGFDNEIEVSKRTIDENRTRVDDELQGQSSLKCEVFIPTNGRNGHGKRQRKLVADSATVEGPKRSKCPISTIHHGRKFVKVAEGEVQRDSKSACEEAAEISVVDEITDPEIGNLTRNCTDCGLTDSVDKMVMLNNKLGTAEVADVRSGTAETPTELDQRLTEAVHVTENTEAVSVCKNDDEDISGEEGVRITPQPNRTGVVELVQIQEADSEVARETSGIILDASKVDCEVSVAGDSLEHDQIYGDPVVHDQEKGAEGFAHVRDSGVLLQFDCKETQVESLLSTASCRHDVSHIHVNDNQGNAVPLVLELVEECETKKSPSSGQHIYLGENRLASCAHISPGCVAKYHGAFDRKDELEFTEGSDGFVKTVLGVCKAISNENGIAQDCSEESDHECAHEEDGFPSGICKAVSGPLETVTHELEFTEGSDGFVKTVLGVCKAISNENGIAQDCSEESDHECAHEEDGFPSGICKAVSGPLETVTHELGFIELEEFHILYKSTQTISKQCDLESGKEDGDDTKDTIGELQEVSETGVEDADQGCKTGMGLNDCSEEGEERNVNAVEENGGDMNEQGNDKMLSKFDNGDERFENSVAGPSLLDMVEECKTEEKTSSGQKIYLGDDGLASCTQITPESVAEHHCAFDHKDQLEFEQIVDGFAETVTLVHGDTEVISNENGTTEGIAEESDHEDTREETAFSNEITTTEYGSTQTISEQCDAKSGEGNGDDKKDISKEEFHEPPKSIMEEVDWIYKMGMQLKVNSEEVEERNVKTLEDNAGNVDEKENAEVFDKYDRDERFENSVASPNLLVMVEECKTVEHPLSGEKIILGNDGLASCTRTTPEGFIECRCAFDHKDHMEFAEVDDGFIETVTLELVHGDGELICNEKGITKGEPEKSSHEDAQEENAFTNEICRFEYGSIQTLLEQCDSKASEENGEERRNILGIVLEEFQEAAEDVTEDTDMGGCKTGMETMDASGVADEKENVEMLDTNEDDDSFENFVASPSLSDMVEECETVENPSTSQKVFVGDDGFTSFTKITCQHVVDYNLLTKEEKFAEVCTEFAETVTLVLASGDSKVIPMENRVFEGNSEESGNKDAGKEYGFLNEICTAVSELRETTSTPEFVSVRRDEFSVECISVHTVSPDCDVRDAEEKGDDAKDTHRVVLVEFQEVSEAAGEVADQDCKVGAEMEDDIENAEKRSAKTVEVEGEETADEKENAEFFMQFGDHEKSENPVAIVCQKSEVLEFGGTAEMVAFGVCICSPLGAPKPEGVNDREVSVTSTSSFFSDHEVREDVCGAVITAEKVEDKSSLNCVGAEANSEKAQEVSEANENKSFLQEESRKASDATENGQEHQAEVVVQFALEKLEREDQDDTVEAEGQEEELMSYKEGKTMENVQKEERIEAINKTTKGKSYEDIREDILYTGDHELHDEDDGEEIEKRENAEAYKTEDFHYNKEAISLKPEEPLEAQATDKMTVNMFALDTACLAPVNASEFQVSSINYEECSLRNQVCTSAKCINGINQAEVQATSVSEEFGYENYVKEGSTNSLCGTGIAVESVEDGSLITCEGAEMKGQENQEVSGPEEIESSLWKEFEASNLEGILGELEHRIEELAYFAQEKLDCEDHAETDMMKGPGESVLEELGCTSLEEVTVNKEVENKDGFSCDYAQVVKEKFGAMEKELKCKTDNITNKEVAYIVRDELNFKYCIEIGERENADCETKNSDCKESEEAALEKPEDLLEVQGVEEIISSIGALGTVYLAPNNEESVDAATNIRSPVTDSSNRSTESHVCQEQEHDGREENGNTRSSLSMHVPSRDVTLEAMSNLIGSGNFETRVEEISSLFDDMWISTVQVERRNRRIGSQTLKSVECLKHQLLMTEMKENTPVVKRAQLSNHTLGKSATSVHKRRALQDLQTVKEQ